MTELPVLLTDDAARDLDEIYARVKLQRSWQGAEEALDELSAAFAEAAAGPLERHPPELLALGIRDYLEAGSGEFRVIYRAEARAVYVLLIVDGRRDLRSLLERRLLEA